MGSFEIIRLEANRPVSRFKPKWRRAALIQKDPEGIPGEPGVVAAKVHLCGCACRGFKQSVHIFAPELKFHEWAFEPKIKKNKSFGFAP